MPSVIVTIFWAVAQSAAVQKYVWTNLLDLLLLCSDLLSIQVVENSSPSFLVMSRRFCIRLISSMLQRRNPYPKSTF
jgi:hypothetical protein